jgi:hypothetical protein
MVSTLGTAAGATDVRDKRPRTAISASWRNSGHWLLVPPASGKQCKVALERAGLVVVEVSDLHVTMRNERAQVRVPLGGFLRPELVATILRDVGVSPALFTSYLDETS